MKQLSDFLPIIIFFLIYKFYQDLPDELIHAVNDWLPFMALTPGEPSDAIFMATFATIVATLIQVFLSMILTRKVEKMPLITLALLVFIGGATLIFKDPVFIQWKPSIINWLFAAVFFLSHFIDEKTLVERMMSQALEINDPAIWNKLNVAWVGFFVFSGLANIVIAPEIDPLDLQFSESTWVDFKLFGLLGLTVVFLVVQAIYLSKYLSNSEEENS